MYVDFVFIRKYARIWKNYNACLLMEVRENRVLSLRESNLRVHLSSVCMSSKKY